MLTLLRTFALSLGSLVAARALSQTPPLDGSDWPRQYFDRKAEAMTVLTGWGAVNVLAGGAGALSSDDEQWRQFHLMNAGWGAINATFGYFGRRGALRDVAADKSVEAAYTDLRRTEKILLFNAGLDLAYIAGGVYVLERSRRPGSDTQDRDRGWGQAIMIQGAALCLFDLLAYRHLHKAEQGLIQLSPGGKLTVKLGPR